MKNEKIKEFLVHVLNIEDFKKEFLKIQEKAQTEGFSKKDNQQFIVETLLPWSKKLGYTFTKQDFITFDKTQNVKQLTGISQEELANVSGGLGLGVLGTALFALLAAAAPASNVETPDSKAFMPSSTSTGVSASSAMNLTDSYGNPYTPVKLSDFADMSSSENFSPADYNFGNWTSKTGESASSFLMQYSNAPSPDGSGSYGNPYYDVTKPGFQIYNNTVNSIPEVSSDKLTEGSATGTEVQPASNAAHKGNPKGYEELTRVEPQATDEQSRSYFTAIAEKANAVKSYVSDAAGRAGSFVSDKGSAAIGAAKHAAGRASSAISGGASYVGGKVSGVAQSAGSAIYDGVSYVESKISGAASSVTSGVSKGASYLYQQGSSAAGSLKDTSLSAFHGLENQLQSIEKSAIELFNKAKDSGAGQAAGQKATQLLGSAQQLLNKAKDSGAGQAASRKATQLLESTQKLLDEAKNSKTGQNAQELLKKAQELLKKATSSSFAQEIKDNPRASVAIGTTLAATVAVIKNLTKTTPKTPEATNEPTQQPLKKRAPGLSPKNAKLVNFN